ncbi:MAG: energy-coupling factor transporter transmembrane component T [Oscillochloridaceae bacterium umkhey_bin13]
MHTLTWLIWLGAGLLAVTLAPNPLYLSLILLATAQVFVSWRSDSPMARSFGLFMRAGALICLGYVIFSVITVGGARGSTVLVALPALRLPDWLGGVVFGGPITAEALAWGLTRGLAIWALMALFGAFNALVDHHRLLRLTPRSLYSVGLAVTIAIAFVPALLRAIVEISQAQRARGHRFGGPRSWVPLVAPLLAGSLERAVQLAEALDARGYGRNAVSTREFGMRQLSLLLGTCLLGMGVLGWLYYGPESLPFTGPIAASGALGLGLGWWTLERRVQRSVYRRERWRQRDSIAIAASLGSVVALLALRSLGRGDLVYYPFPTLHAPGFDLLVGLALLLLATPALMRRDPPRPTPRRRPVRSPRPDPQPTRPDPAPVPCKSG